MEYSIGTQCLCFPLLISVKVMTKIIVLKCKDKFSGVYMKKQPENINLGKSFSRVVIYTYFMLLKKVNNVRIIGFITQKSIQLSH